MREREGLAPPRRRRLHDVLKGPKALSRPRVLGESQRGREAGGSPRCSQPLVFGLVKSAF